MMGNRSKFGTVETENSGQHTINCVERYPRQIGDYVRRLNGFKDCDNTFTELWSAGTQVAHKISGNTFKCNIGEVDRFL